MSSARQAPRPSRVRKPSQRSAGVLVGPQRRLQRLARQRRRRASRGGDRRRAPRRATAPPSLAPRPQRRRRLAFADVGAGAGAASPGRTKRLRFRAIPRSRRSGRASLSSFSRSTSTHLPRSIARPSVAAQQARSPRASAASPSSVTSTAKSSSCSAPTSEGALAADRRLDLRPARPRARPAGRHAHDEARLLQGSTS